MSLAAWFRNTFADLRYADTFALHRADLLEGVRAALARPVAAEHRIVAAHFPKTFEELATFFEQSGTPFEIGDRPLASSSVRKSTGQRRVTLTLAAMLTPDGPGGTVERTNSSVALLMVERHPMLRYDERVEAFMRAIPGRRRFGYYLSLEDPLIRDVAPPRVVDILRQLGFPENGLISSHLVSRAVQRLQRKIQSRVTNEIPADSAEEWLAKNTAT